MSRILVRDLDQLVTPAGAEAPLRGAALGEVDLIERAFLLLSGGSIEPRKSLRQRAATGKHPLLRFSINFTDSVGTKSVFGAKTRAKA